MRITNMMLRNNSLSNVGKAKAQLLKADLQYTSQRKIQRPSDDPVIAVRALKYRTQVSEITQYVEKNIQDAYGWMNVTESALGNIDSIFTTMKGLMDQGANGPLTASDRSDIAGVLREEVNHIYEEANSDYAGRYVFTGYRTDTSLLFGSKETNLSYNITENFTSADIQKVNSVKGGANYAASTSAQDYVDDAAELTSSYRVRLSYDNLSKSKMPVDTDGDATWPADAKENYVTITYTKADGTEETITAITKLSTEDDANDVADDAIHFVADTGELVFGEGVYKEMIANKSSWTVAYTKTEFEGEDIRPEMYFACTSYNSISEKTLAYNAPHGQDIEYEINFSQDLKVNTQACDAVSMDIGRMVDYIITTINDVTRVEDKISEVKQILKSTTDDDEINNLKKLQETLESELAMREQVMQEAFGMGLTMVTKAQAQLSDSEAEHGARYSRLDLTYNKLMEQKDDFEDMLSENEDMDLADAAIYLTQAQSLYYASLQGTMKVLGNSLLDYI